MDNGDDTFRTDDIPLAAFIAAKRGRRWEDWQRVGRRVTFYFDNPADARQLRNEYHRGGLVIAQEFEKWRGWANNLRFTTDDEG